MYVCMSAGRFVGVHQKTQLFGLQRYEVVLQGVEMAEFEAEDNRGREGDVGDSAESNSSRDIVK